MPSCISVPTPSRAKSGAMAVRIPTLQSDRVRREAMDARVQGRGVPGRHPDGQAPRRLRALAVAPVDAHGGPQPVEGRQRRRRARGGRPRHAPTGRDSASSCRRGIATPRRDGTPDYSRVFAAMLEEVLGGYGPVFEVGFRRRQRRRAQRQAPGVRAAAVHRDRAETAAAAAIFSDAGPDIRWVGNERGEAPLTVWATIDRARLRARDAAQPRTR